MSGFLASIFEAFSSAEKTKSADAAAKDDAATATQPRADGHSTQSRPVDGSLTSPQDSNALREEPRQAERSYPLETSDGRAHFLPGAAALPPMPQPHSFRFADQEDATAAALAIPHPAATAAATATGSHHAGGLSAFRMRSLSRMFTRLPEKALPSYPQMVLDQLEFMMHVILLETNPVRALQHMANLKAVYETFGSLPQGKRLLRSGRLYSRSMLCGLAADFVILKVDGGENDMAPHVDGDADDNETSEEAERQITAASDLPSESWASSQQQLATLRAILIQKNANAAPKFQKDSEEERDDSDEIDEQLTKHAMMTVDYDEIYRLLAVQVELTRLKEKLEDMMEDSDHPSECTVLSTSASDETPHASGGGGGIRGGYDKKLSAKSINKNVQKAINEFMKNLSSVYPPAEDTSPRAVEFEDDDDEGFDDLDVDDNEEAQGHESGESAMESPVKSKRRYSISNIPKELHSLVLTELYSPKRKPQRSTDLVARLLTDIMSITSDAPTPALTNPGVFSHANLQSKMRALLIKWSESILEVPTLVQLGYGGVPSPIVDKDEDDVSSWGGDSVLGEETERRTNLVRNQSYTRMVNAAMHGRSSALTDKEKDSIAQIAANGARGAEHSRSNSNDGDALGLPSKPNRKGKRYGTKARTISRSVAVPPLRSPLDGIPGKRPRQHGNDMFDVLNDAEPERSPADRVADRRMHGGSFQSRLDLLSSLACSTEKEKTRNSASRGARGRDDSDNAFGNRHGADDAASDDSSVEVVRRSVKLSRVNLADSRPNKRGRAESHHSRQLSALKENSPPSTKARKAATMASSKLESSRERSGEAMEWTESDDEPSSDVKVKPKRSRSSNETQRRPFTEEEVDAIRSGVALFGKGKWSEIQKNDRRLKHRTAVQLKDKFRNMEKKEEI